MRTLLIASALTLVAAPVAAQTPQPAPDSDVLRAAIWRSASPGLHDAEFVVNRPAYVAVFEVLPSRGAGLLYPMIGSDDPRRVDAGWHPVVVTHRSHRWFYHSPMLASSFGPSRYILVVASETPLRLESIAASPAGLLDVLGAGFGMGGALGTIGEILAIVAPENREADWMYDVFVDGLAPNLTPQRYVALQCGYRVIRVPIELLMSTREMCSYETQVRAVDVSAPELRDWSKLKESGKGARSASALSAKERRKGAALDRLRGPEKTPLTARDRWEALSVKVAPTTRGRWTGWTTPIHRVPRAERAYDHMTVRAKKNWAARDSRSKKASKPDRGPR